jgi:hypothetical protein
MGELKASLEEKERKDTEFFCKILGLGKTEWEGGTS